METTNRTTNLIFASGRGVLVLVVAVVGLVAGIGYLVWRGMSQVPEQTAQVWALLATLAVPAALWLGYRIGSGKASTWLQGLDMGVERVVQAGAEAASLKGQTASTIRRATQPEPETVVELPQLDAHYQVLEALPSGEEVDL